LFLASLVILALIALLATGHLFLTVAVGAAAAVTLVASARPSGQ
jgi:hypothetical protein